MRKSSQFGHNGRHCDTILYITYGRAAVQYQNTRVMYDLIVSDISELYLYLLQKTRLSKNNLSIIFEKVLSNISAPIKHCFEEMAGLVFETVQISTAIEGFGGLDQV